MAISFFDKTYCKSLGLSNKVICPDCQKTVELSLFESLDVSALSLFLGKEPSEYFALCPTCASVFHVNPVYMTERQKGTFCILTPDDLTSIKESHADS